MQCMVFQPLLVHAAPSASLSFSSSTVKVGDTVTATFTVSGGDIKLGALQGEVTYNTEFLTFVPNESASDIFESAKGTILLVPSPNAAGASSFSFQLTFKALKAGSATLSAYTTELASASSEYLDNVSANKSVNIRAISTDATLKALSVEKGTLSPKFASGTTAYTVSVANNVSSITVNATATDSKAKVTGTGKTNLSVGKNTISVKVTAEDGSTTKTYIITVTRAAATPTPTKAPTSAPVTTTPPATTTAPTETAPTGETPAETTPAVGTPTQTATETTSGTTSETPSGTVAETPTATTNPTEMTETATPTADLGGSIKYNGLFSVQAAFAFCAIGMFFVGGTVGFILCYVIKSKKRKNDDKDET